MEHGNVTAAECGHLLLATIPDLMRSLTAAVRHQRVAGEEPLSMSQFLVLAMLAHHASSLKELAAIHHVTPSTMSRSVDLLVRRGWVQREHAAQDRRQITLSLTPDGRTARQDMQQHIADRVIALMASLDGDGLRDVYSGLQVLKSLLASSEQSSD